MSYNIEDLIPWTTASKPLWVLQREAEIREREQADKAVRKAEEARYYSGCAEEDDQYVFQFARAHGIREQDYTESYWRVRELKIETRRALANEEYVGTVYYSLPAGKCYLVEVPAGIILFPGEDSDYQEPNSSGVRKLSFGEEWVEKYADRPVLIVNDNMLFLYQDRGTYLHDGYRIVPSFVIYPST